ncbi:MAG: RagB/SusD family nutrient uptake outer membrane protein, partial [Muribaculaceae bacterium]|nr:RagB/SusD family nutrient uptake outer membrane protein [Muribaculaceae bacterium]
IREALESRWLGVVYMRQAIDQGSTKVTDLLECDTTKVMDAYRKRDPRLCLNVITPYSHYLGTDAGSTPMDKQFVLADASKGGAPMEAMAFIRNSEGWNSYFWRKWIPTGNLDGYWGEYNRTPYEFPLIRLGDVILMLAEAYNESGATAKAIDEVNKIRARAGMPGLNSGPAWLSVSGKEEMAERIRRERAFELAGEGQRYWDLRRWGLLRQSVTDATDIFGDLMYTRSYQPRHELWPIPLVEMERNTNLTQNEGW